MEEQPKDRAEERHLHPHKDDRNSVQHTPRLKHDQSQLQCQHQETQAKKTGNKKVNITGEELERNTQLPDTAGMLHPSSSNGSRHFNNAYVKQKGTHRHHVPKMSHKGSDHKKIMDLRNEKDSSHLEVSDRRDSGLLQNGVGNSGLITNGFSGKDNDGSGSEGGYSTPKKRKTRCNNAKNADHMTKEKDVQSSTSLQELRTSSQEVAEKGLSRSAHRADPQSATKRVSEGESQRKNSDGKSAAIFSKKTEEKPKGKLSSPTKEDSWTLFKPPPVFPVDNSSAKIVPKISYASKVKENLRVAQGGGEPAPPPPPLPPSPPPPPVRMSQVPMSAMKTITSASFTNGPSSGVGGCCPGGTTFFTPAGLQPAAPVLSGENVASSLDSSWSSMDGENCELPKCSLLIYPLNMQPVLPSARRPHPPAVPANHKVLGDIFQNQWGLSFINEPNLGAEGGNGPAAVDGRTSGASQSQVAIQVALACPDISLSTVESGTLSQDSQQRTCDPCRALGACSPARGVTEEATCLPCGQDQTRAGSRRPDCFGSNTAKDTGPKCAQARLPTLLFGPPKEWSFPKGSTKRGSWGGFDLRAAVAYHTKEMESILNMQKQDPKRVVTYNKTKDEAGH